MIFFFSRAQLFVIGTMNVRFLKKYNKKRLIRFNISNVFLILRISRREPFINFVCVNLWYQKEAVFKSSQVIESVSRNIYNSLYSTSFVVCLSITKYNNIIICAYNLN